LGGINYPRNEVHQNGICRHHPVQPNRRRIERGTLSRLSNIDGILGLQFENIALKNRLAIFERMHIDPNDVLYDNPFFQRKTLRHAGCQIDYLPGR
jgi:hypothetical protein